jgi:hypothetical protein
MQKPMYIGDFVDLVHRNSATPDIRFITNSGKSNPGVAANTCTLLAGAWLPVIKTDDPSAPAVNPNHIGAWNVAVPDIPEKTVIDPETQRIVHRGWKELLMVLLQERVLRPTPEVIGLCGDDWDKIRKWAGIRCY